MIRRFAVVAVAGLVLACDPMLEPTPPVGSVVVAGQVLRVDGAQLVAAPNATLRGQVLNRAAVGRDTVANCIGNPGDAFVETTSGPSGEFALTLFDYLYDADSVCLIIVASGATGGDTAMVLSRPRLRKYNGGPIKDTVRMTVTLR